MRLALTDMFRARWTNEIHEEWIAAVLEDHPNLARQQLERTRDMMNDAVLDCVITGYEGMANHVALPDANDRHVLAAAIRCQAGVIVTSNLKDFPQATLSQFGIEAQHPDEFISHLFDLSPAVVCTTVKKQRKSLTRPPQTIDELLNTFLSLGLATTVESLRTMKDLL